ncbi:MAG: phosphoglycerate mutase (2,3-diphosphoglycerate-independent) [Bacteroidetes bacterium GWF2_42_66]|nr:MAG: phosphoglycerate mutase (2,3-diphosphoglycerate-independent) [Bacteroidetes bacterium GWA2_42_15]OFX96473.1 MAG: phosphoglycerate mutase (2,3-diphosphoglycerate-independent) [Bacteroidetes bacterium GWE2_42_39]OFY40893.1 MAG: phosphoglycerate mutase (2,3-diphosphoglycerate-independent) [Bacteroidetes bacterium GWF2_42_66]HBL76324.1 2,3-bisphosphoglycerate-independent phosphoglycerate mutase [Prolixibacteraceae bacterium]HCR92122.1 2,3-bisphosphoglycerate-independent phosphoglycerate mut
MADTKKAILMILDGWGIGDGSERDVIATAPTPFIDSLMKEYPNSQLLTCGENVGLPDGQMGNSEVGHLNIGAGRVLYQDMVKITKAIREKTMWSNPKIVEAYTYAKENNKKVHLIGLIGPGGVHALSSHMVALCQIGTDMGLDNIFIHGLTDGRDTDPRSGYGFLEADLEALKPTNGKFASIIGRYFGMDRDKNYDRLKLAYDMYTHGVGEKSTDLLATVKASYDAGVTDEFLKPIVMVDEKGQPLATIEEGDVVICFNFRTDRLRQTTIAFTQKDLPEFGMHTMNLKWYTMTNYKADFKGINVIFDKENPTNTMGEIVSKAGLKQIRIAETEKYAHVTFFFSGGREEEFPGESRILIQSPKVPTYDFQPEMSAPLVKDAIVAELKKGEVDFVCLNFANGDMVGHTGVYEAIYKAISAVDQCAKEVVEAARANGYEVLIIADHGNADNAVNEDGSPNTAHSLNPVPCIYVSDNKNAKISNGVLADVAPTLLTLMGLEIPAEMTGKILIEK